MPGLETYANIESDGPVEFRERKKKEKKENEARLLKKFLATNKIQKLWKKFQLKIGEE